MSSCKPHIKENTFHYQSPETSEPEAMQIGHTCLTSAERQSRLHNYVCLYHGETGHMKSNCLVKAHAPPTSMVSTYFQFPKKVCLPVQISLSNHIINTSAFVDSSSASIFIDLPFAKKNITFPSCLVYLC